jgi:hypothetical protein
VTDKKADPTGRQALFSGAAPVTPSAVASSAPASSAPASSAPASFAPASCAPASGVRNEGKQALFSMAPWRPGTVVIECAGCKVRRRASLIEVGTRLVMGSIWYPFRRHPHWMGCPSCGRHQWCRIGWAE